jgi:hypothetical protein
MKIKLKGPFNQSWIDVNTSSARLSDFLSEISADKKAFPMEFFNRHKNQVTADCEIYLNGKSYSALADGLDSKLNEGDEIEIIIIIMTGG